MIRIKHKKHLATGGLILSLLLGGSAAVSKYNPPTQTTPNPTAVAVLSQVPTVPFAASNLNISCHINGVLPDSSCTPGAINPDIFQSNIAQTICNHGNWSTKSIRPPVSYTNNLKIQQIADYGYDDMNTADYEEDHLISLELGGSPTDPKNLWPEPYYTTPNAHTKDTVENNCNKAVCSGKLTLQEAQKEIATDWQTACQ